MSNSELRIHRCAGRDLAQNIPSPSKQTQIILATQAQIFNYNLDTLDCKYAFLSQHCCNKHSSRKIISLHNLAEQVSYVWNSCGSMAQSLKVKLMLSEILIIKSNNKSAHVKHALAGDSCQFLHTCVKYCYLSPKSWLGNQFN